MTNERIHDVQQHLFPPEHRLDLNCGRPYCPALIRIVISDLHGRMPSLAHVRARLAHALRVPPKRARLYLASHASWIL